MKNCYADTSSWTNIERLCGLFDIFEVGFMGMFLFKFYENFMKLCDPMSISLSFKPSFFWNPNNQPTPFQFKPLIQSPQSQKRQKPQFKILEFLSRAITYENVSYQIPYLECPFLFYFFLGFSFIFLYLSDMAHKYIREKSLHNRNNKNNKEKKRWFWLSCVSTNR